MTNGGPGGCRLRGLGTSGQTYQLQATPTLVNPLITLSLSDFSLGG
jgi:hypothetical protein